MAKPVRSKKSSVGRVQSQNIPNLPILNEPLPSIPEEDPKCNPFKFPTFPVNSLPAMIPTMPAVPTFAFSNPPANVESTFPDRAVSSNTTDVDATTSFRAVPLDSGSTIGTRPKTGNGYRSTIDWSKPLFPKIMCEYTLNGRLSLTQAADTVAYTMAETRIIYYLQNHLYNVPGYHPYDKYFWKSFEPESVFYEYAQFQIQCIEELDPNDTWTCIRPYPFIKEVKDQAHIPKLSAVDLFNCTDEELDEVVDEMCRVMVSNILYIGPQAENPPLSNEHMGVSCKRSQEGSIVCVSYTPMDPEF